MHQTKTITGVTSKYKKRKTVWGLSAQLHLQEEKLKYLK